MNKLKIFCQGFVFSAIVIAIIFAILCGGAYLMVHYPALTVFLILFSTCLMGGFIALNA